MQGGVIRFDLGPGTSPPTITTQPQSQTVTSGATVTFSVVATGTPPLTHRWRKDGANLAGATDASLSLANVALTDAGNYDVVVTNQAGSVTSAPATLVVVAGAAVRHPADVTPADNRITLAEMIAYATAYKRGQPWLVGPSPVPLDHMTRAATLYKRGETYRYDPTAGPAPLCWVNSATY